MLIESIIIAIIPAMLYASLIYFVDRYEREPLWLLSTMFLWGAIPAIILALILNGLFGLPFYLTLGDYWGDVATAVLVAPLVEETVKGFALLLLFWVWRHHLDTLLDGVVYGAMVGLGFAMVENVFYFVQQYELGGTEAWQLNIFLRAFIFGLNHSLYSAMMGLGLAAARLSNKRWVWFVAPFLGWSAAVFIHFLHNLFASSGDLLGALVCIPLLANAWGGLIITAVIIIWSLWQEQKWIKEYLFEEIALGTLTPLQYAAISSSWRRWTYRFQLIFSHGPRTARAADKFYTRASQLAYSKHHYEIVPDEAAAQRIIDLRQNVVKLGENLLF